MPTDTMERLKSVLLEQEQLFGKLHLTGERFNDVEIDESGFFEEAYQTAFRRYDTVTGKIIDAINAALDNCTARRLDVKNPGLFSLRLSVHCQDDEGNETANTTLSIDYSTQGSLKIEQH